MEHLPPVSSPYEPVLVPHIADEEYDGLAFAEYPTRRGFDIDSLLKGDFKTKSPGEIAAFLQTWLYFGLIYEIFQVKLDPHLVRKDVNGGEWITTEKLPRLLWHAKALFEKAKQLPEYTPENVEKRNERITNVVRTSFHVWEGFQKLGEKNPIPPEVALGIQILAITLQVGLTDLLGGEEQEENYRVVPWERDGRHWRLAKNEWLENRMIGQGWCPVIIEQTRRSFNTVGLYYCSLLGPPGGKLDHRKCKKSEPDCDAMRNFETEHGTHVVEGCECEFLVVDSSKLGDIIAKDAIPVLYLCEEDGKAALEVVSSASEDGLEYTAMSHVYVFNSDGVLLLIPLVGVTVGEILCRTLCGNVELRRSSIGSPRVTKCRTFMSNQSKANITEQRNTMSVFSSGWILYVCRENRRKYMRRRVSYFLFLNISSFPD
jgi:hypothetical protein